MKTVNLKSHQKSNGKLANWINWNLKNTLFYQIYITKSDRNTEHLFLVKDTEIQKAPDFVMGIIWVEIWGEGENNKSYHEIIFKFFLSFQKKKKTYWSVFLFITVNSVASRN